MKLNTLLALIAAGFTFTAAHAAVDSYLYWMVDGANYNGSAINFDYATISGDSGATYLNIFDSNGQSQSQYLPSDAYMGGSVGNSTSGGAYAGLVSGTTYSSFLVELWLDSNERVGWQTYSYASLVDYIYTTTPSSVTPFSVTAVVPEPTSGLLSLFGLAALALRRRRRA